jgi:hypothetical protein
MAPPRCFFLFFMLGLDSLQHIAGLGDVREINLGRNRLRGARGCRTALSGRGLAALKLRANLVRLIVFQRTGMGLAAGQAEFRQYIENLPALDFHLAREIVDSNLTHPPLFKLCFPKPLVAHSYLMALAGFVKCSLHGLARRGASYAPSSLAACSSVVALSVSISSSSGSSVL